MPSLSWLISKTMQFFLGSAQERRADAAAREKGAGTFDDTARARGRNFDDDYRAATTMLKTRVDREFPDSYYARLSSKSNSSYDYGQDRALAVDTMSTAIAMALRGGATVRQAADAGAASVGI
ncbi:MULTISPECIES: hypothetical protein [Methylobacterium]|jgi:hypothetical protein|uniref:Uncharacterized protein n=1 Tax=Methylobacterium longum TaxID=767694 RepID=A0ABT8AIQ6_9HYPH|nr:MULTISPECIES: hypothetical protein [Methylobacterium]MCJ2100141.1 hypothetical protein [Methylobacterium sp. E-046]MDN3569341.1 hypothetical protein [Methylobacterium longum]GJE12365.1 hypothetical protein FOHLNKBM_3414 [Methylobacterium longum]